MRNIKYTTTNEFKSKVFFANFSISLKCWTGKKFFSVQNWEKIERESEREARENCAEQKIKNPKFYCSIWGWIVLGSAFRAELQIIGSILQRGSVVSFSRIKFKHPFISPSKTHNIIRKTTENCSEQTNFFSWYL